jgi:PadR family transcriptional regulator PadR
MTRTRRPSAQTRAVLEFLHEHGDGWSYGYEISKVTGIASGTLYPLLMRLADRGYLESTWEPAEMQGRPPRRVCRLTSAGKRYAAQASREAAGRIVRRPVGDGV